MQCSYQRVKVMIHHDLWHHSVNMLPFHTWSSWFQTPCEIVAAAICTDSVIRVRKNVDPWPQLTPGRVYRRLNRKEGFNCKCAAAHDATLVTLHTKLDGPWKMRDTHSLRRTLALCELVDIFQSLRSETLVFVAVLHVRMRLFWLRPGD